IRLLKENVFGSEELQDMFQIEEVNLSDKEKILNDDGYTMLLEVPENFTYDTLRTMVLGEKREAELIIYENDQQQIAAGILKNVLGQFQEKLTKETFLQQNQLDSGLVLANNENLANEIIPIEEKNPINAKKYYTVGMATMNVLFIASVIGSFAFLEKKTQVFDRIILANVSRWLYFVGILISSALFAFLQLLIIYGFSWIVFDVAFPDAYAFFMTTGIYALAVGGIAVLLTAISYRLESETLTNFFSGVIVTIMAFIGGSFFPIGDSSEIIQQLGNYTPNGASMSAYLALLRGDGFAEIADHLTFLVLFAFASTVVAAMTFPKRGISS
ncbi:MAG TPA: ABC transporter permease, partial [Bacillota bacterium]|nr:ABC transporter permease [Bacillota bacterium]